MNAVLQWVVVALVVGWSLLLAFRRLLPGVSRRLQTRLGEICLSHGWTRLARLLHATVPAVPGCEAACPGCDTVCSKAPAPAEQPVKWRSPPSSGACH